METQISIIIPIYNAEKYLEQCVRSVLCQTLQELEIICIDDGSTDGSVQIIQRLALEDARIVLLRQENQGSGPARNLGIRNAGGKYIAFLDADDYYEDREALQLLFQTCETKNLSVCASKYKHMIYTMENTERTEELLPQIQISQEGVYVYFDYQMDFDYMHYLFLKRLLVENEIYFPAYRRFQDPPFFVKALYMANRFGLVDTCLYSYREADLDTRFNTLKTADLLRGLLDNLSFAKEHGLDILFRTTADRLEYEYANIIIKNISPDDLSILHLLIQANQVISDQYGKPDYIIRPLRILLLPMNRYEKILLQKIEEHKEIALYGAGKFAKIFMAFLKKKNLADRVRNIVVSDLSGNQPQMEGIPVIAFRDFVQGKERHLFVTTGGKNQKEILDYLKQNHFTDFDVVEDVFLDTIAEE